MQRAVLFICIHNSARSQMAEAFLRKHGGQAYGAESAGLEPGKMNANVVTVMGEIGIDLSKKQTCGVFDIYRSGKTFDAVITVCDAAGAERCPVFAGNVQREAWSLADPSAFTGNQVEILAKTRAVRDIIEEKVKDFISRAANKNYWVGILKKDIGMETTESIKAMVMQKYSEIALQDKATNESSCCGSGGCTSEVYNIMSEDYTTLDGYAEDADLGLGCGLPTRFAKIKEGDVVIDLGSGAGNDAFIARAETGAMGKVIGIDFTAAMIEKASANAEKLGFPNVAFLQGDIEHIPVDDGIADVVVSNCVLNLVPDKDAVFKEIYRVLNPVGHFCISDIVLVGALPQKIQQAAEMYAGCVAGAIQKEVYLDIIGRNGFQQIEIQKEKAIIIPDDILSRYLTEREIVDFKKSDSGIFSVTVYAIK